MGIYALLTPIRAKILKLKYKSSFTDKHSNDCMTVAIPKHTSKYKQLAEELQGTISHRIPNVQLDYVSDRTLHTFTLFFFK